MNKRIKELALSSGLYDCLPEELEKFAALIVKECMEIAFAYDAPKLSGPGMIIANQIEDHFGIDPEGYCTCCGAKSGYQKCDESCVWSE